MKCPNCGHDMGKRAKCLRCGYTIKAVIPIDPEKIEKEKEPQTERREIHPDDVHVSRAGGGGIFGDIFGGGLFGNLFGDIFGGSIFGDLFGGFDDNSNGYEYDPKYYDDFGNEIYIPDEFERESVEIRDFEYLENPEHKKTPPKTEQQPHKVHEQHKRPEYSQNKKETRERAKAEQAERYNTNKFRKHKRKDGK